LFCGLERFSHPFSEPAMIQPFVFTSCHERASCLANSALGYRRQRRCPWTE
jgi:hypothetical protein